MAEEIITSVHNPQIKRLHQLLSRKGREETGQFLIEGTHLVEEALRSQADVPTLLFDVERGIDPVCQAALREYAGRVNVLAVSPQVLDKLAETKTPQGIVAVVTQKQQAWTQWLEQQEKTANDFLILLLDELQDPGNLGTILRTAEAAGIDAVFLGERSVDLYNGKVVLATMGALFRLPIYRVPLAQAARQLKQVGTNLLVTSVADDSVAYDRVAYAGKTAIVIGNEGRGVSAELASLATSTVHIPIFGKAESLNAAVAAGIMLYEAQRKRRSQGQSQHQ